MLIGDNQPAFDSPNHIFELKLDGIRCLAYLWGDGLELQNKRNKRIKPDKLLMIKWAVNTQ